MFIVLSSWQMNVECAERHPASALLLALRYALPGYGERQVWVRGPGWPDHCVRI